LGGDRQHGPLLWQTKDRPGYRPSQLAEPKNHQFLLPFTRPTTPRFQMLPQETVEPRTLGLLKDLLQIEELAHFALLGGTSLALRWGHRQSEDLDLFSNQVFEEDRLLEALEERYPNLTVSSQEKQTLRLFIENVKIEIIAPKRPYLKPFEYIEGIRFLVPKMRWRSF
jgi:hypothetical protein